MKWDYTKRCVYIYIPVHVKEFLIQFKHKTQNKPQHQPYPSPERTFGADTQKVKPIDTSSTSSTELVNRIDCILKIFLYYASVVYNTCIFPLRKI